MSTVILAVRRVVVGKAGLQVAIFNFDGERPSLDSAEQTMRIYGYGPANWNVLEATLLQHTDLRPYLPIICRAVPTEGVCLRLDKTRSNPLPWLSSKLWSDDYNFAGVSAFIKREWS